jgi:multidrug efflux pump subunit AcrB
LNLTISIIVSLIFLPVIINLLHFKKQKKDKNKQKKESVHWDVSKYVLVFIKTKKRALATIISFWLLFAFIISLVVFKVIKVDFMSSIDSNNITVNLNYKP